MRLTRSSLANPAAVAIVGLWVGVADGISAGEQVIVRGAERLQPGQAVEVIETISAR